MAEIYLLWHFDLYLQDGTILDFVIGGPRRRMPRQTEALLVHSSMSTRKITHALRAAKLARQKPARQQPQAQRRSRVQPQLIGSGVDTSPS